jgi:hypothetical protein
MPVQTKNMFLRNEEKISEAASEAASEEVSIDLKSEISDF